jgi:hypothetical protein
LPESGACGFTPAGGELRVLHQAELDARIRDTWSRGE